MSLLPSGHSGGGRSLDLEEPEIGILKNVPDGFVCNGSSNSFNTG
jgi:hypothetical protein